MPALVLLLFLPASAHANDLRSRFGFGFHAGLSTIPALSVRYALPTARPEVNVQVELDVGFDVNGDSAGAVVGGRALYGVVAEDNMSLYVAAGAAYVAEGEDPAIRLQPAMGAEFFMFGLENLGFGVEWGINVDLGASPVLKTVSGAPAVTVHYWF